MQPSYLSMIVVFTLEVFGGDVRRGEDVVVDDVVSHLEELLHVLFTRLAAVVGDEQNFLAHRLEFIDSTGTAWYDIVAGPQHPVAVTENRVH